MAGSETCVPAEALTVDGTAPAVGDEFEFTGKGRATRVEEGKVYFETTEVNGKPVASDEAAQKEPDADDVMKAAMAADSQGAGAN